MLEEIQQRIKTINGLLPIKFELATLEGGKLALKEGKNYYFISDNEYDLTLNLVSMKYIMDLSYVIGKHDGSIMTLQKGLKQ